LKHRMILSIISILFLSTILLQEPVSFVVSTQSTENIYNMTPDIDCLHLVSDTNFTDEPTHGTNGTSGEFSTNFLAGSTSYEFNYIELKWEHEPGGLLQLRDDYSGSDHEPDSWDYAYFSESIEWPYESLPVSCLSILEFEVVCTGDFMDEYLGPNVYEVLVMLIDSRGNFARLQSEEFLGDGPYGYYSAQLSSWIVEYGWGGMVENEQGYQEDLVDIAELRIALAPSSEFFVGELKTLSGSVSVNVKYIDLQVLADIPPISASAEPVAIGSAGHNTSINYVEMVMSPNGSIFTLGRTCLLLDWGVIVKWDNQAQPVWIQEWRDDATSGIAADDQFIYTVGQQNDDVSLAVWSHEGQLVQEIFYNISHSDFGVDVCVISTGELYILGYSRNHNEYTPFLMKLNPNFSMKWQMLFDTRDYRTSYQLYLNENGIGYVQIGNQFTKIRNEAISRSSMIYNAESYLVTRNENLWCTMSILDYTAPLFTSRRDLRISNVEFSSANEIHTAVVRYRYSPVYYDSSWHSSIAIDDDEQSIYTLALKGVSFLQYLIVKLDLEGSITWCKSIENGRGNAIPDNWKTWYDLRVLDNDMICVAGTDFQGYSMNLTLAIYNLNPSTWIDSIDWLLIGSIVGAVVITDVAIIYYMKRRKRPVQEEDPELQEAFDDLFENS